MQYKNTPCAYVQIDEYDRHLSIEHEEHFRGQVKGRVMCTS